MQIPTPLIFRDCFQHEGSHDWTLEDASLSYPLVASTVPVWLLATLAIVLPSITLAILQVNFAFGPTMTHRRDQKTLHHAVNKSSIGK